MYQANNIFNDRINQVAEKDKVPQRSTPVMPICVVRSLIMCYRDWETDLVS